MNQKQLAEKLYRESRMYSSEFRQDFFYDDGNIVFSGALTNNSWINRSGKLGSVRKGMTPSECTEYAQRIFSKIENENKIIGAWKN